ncbi:MAG: hypothetical protein COT84_04565 [Chlamydiae bacterium CG10_big_fil_rev_8_21_14_0_10_35_9]|nr:MAG: hypothetical protein COT84_04565 [Chlamydiae bacterium CG10_big_fil_rev_8_21_14_0_10_35_9]
MSNPVNATSITFLHLQKNPEDDTIEELPTCLIEMIGEFAENRSDFLQGICLTYIDKPLEYSDKIIKLAQNILDVPLKADFFQRLAKANYEQNDFVKTKELLLRSVAVLQNIAYKVLNKSEEDIDSDDCYGAFLANFRKLATSYACFGDIDSIERLTRKISSLWDRSCLLEEVVEVYITLKNLEDPAVLEKTLKLAHTIPYPHFRSSALRKIALAYSEKSFLEKILQDAENAAYAITYKPFKVTQFKEIALAYYKYDLPKAKELLSEAVSIVRTISSQEKQFNALIEIAFALVEAKDCDKARELAQQAEELIRRFPNDLEQAYALKKVITVYVQLKDLIYAETLADEIMDFKEVKKYLMLLIFEEVFLAYVELGDESSAQKVLSKVERIDINSIEKQNRFPFQDKIIDFYIQFDRLHEAQEIDCTAHTLKKIVLAYIERGSLTKAERIAKKMPFGEEKFYALKEVAKAYDKYSLQDKGNTAIQTKGIKILMEALNDANKNVQNEPTKFTFFRIIASGFIELRDFSLAREVADKIFEETGQFSILIEIAMAAIKHENIDEALLALEKSKTTIEKVTDDWEKSSCLKKIVSLYIEIGHLDYAEKVANTIIHEQVRSTCLQKVASAHIKFKNLGKALEITNGISDVQAKCFVLNEIITFLNSFITKVDLKANQTSNKQIRASSFF